MVAELHEANLLAEVAIDHIAVEQGLDVVGSEYRRACGGRNVTCNDAIPPLGRIAQSEELRAHLFARWLVEWRKAFCFQPQTAKRNGISP